MPALDEKPFGVFFKDVTGQKRFHAPQVLPGHSVEELVGLAMPAMRLSTRDNEGRPIAYRARLEREGRYLNGSEVVGDALQADDVVSLHPSIDAGAM